MVKRVGRVAILLGLVMLGACAPSPAFDIDQTLADGELALRSRDLPNAERAFLLVMDEAPHTPQQTRRALLGLADCYERTGRSNKLVILATCEESETLEYSDCRRLAFHCSSESEIEAAFQFSETGLRRVRPEGPRDVEFEELHARLKEHPWRGRVVREEPLVRLEGFPCDF